MTPLSFVAYINGSRFYPTAVSASFPANGFAAFVLDVPPSPDWLALPIRSMAAVFFKDPVTADWRLLCDGEYVARSSVSTAAGTRTMSLQFRSLHAWTETQKYFTLLNVVSARGSAMEATAQAAVNGYVFNVNSKDGTQTAPPFQTLADFISRGTVVQDAPSMFSQVLQAIALQAPVDAFYYKFRKLMPRQVYVNDRLATELFSNQFFAQMIAARQDLFQRYTNGTSIASVIDDILSLAFYHKVDLPSPPYIAEDTDASSAELRAHVFLPKMYETVPPASNVIFLDQIITDHESISFMAVPSRVTTQLNLLGVPVKEDQLPIYYVATSPTDSLDINNAENLPLLHGAFSTDELTRGVVNVMDSVSLQSADLPPNDVARSLPAYMDGISRFKYIERRGEALTRTVTCQFLPYVMPGFTVFVENPQGAYYGYVAAVSHAASCTGSATTTLQLTHVRPMQQQQGHNNNPPMPRWFNTAYQAAKIDETFKLFYGVANGACGASAPVDSGSAAASPNLYAPPFNLDAHAARLFFVPSFDADGKPLDYNPSDPTVADELRLRGIELRQQAFYQYQYRAGTSLAEYMSYYQATPPAAGDASQGTPVFSTTSDIPRQMAFTAAFGTPASLTLSATQLAASKARDAWYTEQADAAATATAGIFDVSGIRRDRYDIAAAIQDRITAINAPMHRGEPAEVVPDN